MLHEYIFFFNDCKASEPSAKQPNTTLIIVLLGCIFLFWYVSYLIYYTVSDVCDTFFHLANLHYI